MFSSGVVESLHMDHDELEVIFMLFNQNKTTSRNFKWQHIRLNWEDHLEKERHQNTFESKYHMSEKAFNKLLQHLRDDITVDFTKSRNSTQGNEPIYPELIVATGLRFLGGSTHKDLEDIFGLSLNSVKRVIKMFLKAVLSCSALALKLPETIEEYEKLAEDFCERSSAGEIYFGVIGTLDGWLCTINQPTVPNMRDYYSGHYQRFGMNVQAICDAHLRFIYFSVAAPGGMNDIRALHKCIELNRFIDALKDRYFFLGDNAYGLSEKILIPFSGAQKKVIENDSYNYYLSQLRIRIEQAFGLLTTKWRIFRSNLSTDLRTAADIINAASRLHNFVINEDGDVNIVTPDSEEGELIDPMTGASDNLGYLASDNTAATHVTGNSMRRIRIVKELKDRDIQRPPANIERNAMENI
jgi:hypothetical protein